MDAVIVGFGNRAKSLVARLGERTGIRAVAVVEPVAERRRAAQAECGIGAAGSLQMITEGAGAYRLAVDDASGVTAESRHFAALIAGTSGQGAAPEADQAISDQADAATTGQATQADAGEAPTVEAVFEAQRLVESIYAACGLPKTRRLETWVRES